MPITIKKEIIFRINRGDARAFEQLYSVYYVYLCAVATKYVYSAETAKEIVNDVFLSVWNNHQSLSYPVNNYLVRSVQNRCLNYLRGLRVQEVPLSDVQEQLLMIREHQLEETPYPLAHLENKEFEQHIYKAVNTLPGKCRDIFIQYLYQNKTYDEIARNNGIATSTVRVQIKIGLAKMKDILGDYYPLLLLLLNISQK